MIHVEARLFFRRRADDFRGNAGDGRVRGNVVEHDRTRADFRAAADFDVAEDFRSRADEHAGAHLRVAVSARFSRAAERDGVKNRDVVFDDGGFADDEPRRVVEQDAAADFRRGMNVDGKRFRNVALQVMRDVASPGVPEVVRDAVGRKREKTFEPQERREHGVARGIALRRGAHVVLRLNQRARVPGEGFAGEGGKGLVFLGRAGKLVRDARAERFGEGFAHDDEVVDDVRDQRLVPRDFFSANFINKVLRK